MHLEKPYDEKVSFTGTDYYTKKGISFYNENGADLIRTVRFKGNGDGRGFEIRMFCNSSVIDSISMYFDANEGLFRYLSKSGTWVVVHKFY